MTEPLTELSDVTPQDALAFLRENGWSPWGDSGGRGVAELWQRSVRGRRQEVLVPLRPEAVDYQRAWRDLLSQVATFEQQSPAAVAEAMLFVSADVAEWRAVQASEHEYTLPLDDAQKLISSVRDALVAAASASLQRRSYFGHHKTKQAREHARLVRMGQTRRGSYIIPIISRLPGAEVDAKQPPEERLLEATVVPYQRQVMATLARGLSTVHRLAVQAEQEPSTRDLNEAVVEGVSAELCEAVGGSFAATTIRELDVSFKWASRIAPPRGAENQMIFPMETMPVVASMARRLRESDTPGSQLIFGTVVNLHRNEDEDVGVVTVNMVLGNERRQVRMRLRPDAHDVATDAYKRRRVISAYGVLNRPSGRGWYLDDVTDFGIVQPQLFEQ
jgi:hypothetical protein